MATPADRPPRPPAAEARTPDAEVRIEVGNCGQYDNSDYTGVEVRRNTYATILFIFHVLALLAYIGVRLHDIIAMPKQRTGLEFRAGERVWSATLLAVEVLFGVTALTPYAYFNIKHVKPVQEPERPKGKRDPSYSSARGWHQLGFGSRHNPGFHIFVIVCCYKEDNSDVERSLHGALEARVPPGCTRHVILADDGHAKGGPDRSGIISRAQRRLWDHKPRKPYWYYKVHHVKRQRFRLDDNGHPIADGPAQVEMPGNNKSKNLNHSINYVVPEILANIGLTMRDIQQLDDLNDIIHNFSVPREAANGSPGAAPAAADTPAPRAARSARRHVSPLLRMDANNPLLRQSVVVVLDADQVIQGDVDEWNRWAVPPRNGDNCGFFPKILRPMLADRDIDVVLTPQTFSNVKEDADLYNHLNPQFWLYILPALSALGYVPCTGTNMGLRLSVLRMLCEGKDSDAAVRKLMNGLNFHPRQGARSVQYEQRLQYPFPTYTSTEDYAISMRAKKHGVKSTYIAEYLVKGLAPMSLKGVTIQRGRWTEGHWQIALSKRNPLFAMHKMGLWQVALYNYGTFAYLCTIVTLWVYMCVPLLSAFGIQPVYFSPAFKVSATMYLFSVWAVRNYAASASDFRGMWRADLSNTLLSWTYIQAIGRAMFTKQVTFATHTEVRVTNSSVTRVLTRRSSSTWSETRHPGRTADPSSEVGAFEEGEKLRDFPGNYMYFALMSLVGFVTLIGMVVMIASDGSLKARAALTGCWAMHNLIPPLMFWLFVSLEKSDTLSMFGHMMPMVQNALILGPLVSMWFVENDMAVGVLAQLQPGIAPIQGVPSAALTPLEGSIPAVSSTAGGGA